MPYVLIRHKVEDYRRWKPAFDAHGATRNASGSKGGRLLCSAEDPNELVILLEWDNLQKARQFAQSDDLRNTMQRAGVVGKPEGHEGLSAVQRLHGADGEEELNAIFTRLKWNRARAI